MKINCILLYNYIRNINIIDFILSVKTQRIFIPVFDTNFSDFYNNNMNIKIKAIFIEEKDKEKSLENLNNSLKLISKDILDYTKKNKNHIIDYIHFEKKEFEKGYFYLINNKREENKEKIVINYEIKEPIIISYYFNEDLDDYSETCTNKDLYFFMRTKIYSIEVFIHWIFYFLNYSSIFGNFGFNKFLENELIIINNKINQRNIKYILNLFWNHCKFKDVNFNIDEFFKNYKDMISLYFEKTSLDSREPRGESCLYWIHLEMQKLFFNSIYPILFFNYNLYSFYKDIKRMDSLFGYKNDIKPEIIIDLLKQKGFYIPEHLKKSLNLKQFVQEITNEGPIFYYEKYVDFTELINSIKKSKFHNNDNLNSLFQTRAINYIINGDSLIHIFIEELIKLISNIDRNYLNDLRDLKIKVYNKNEVTSNLNTSRITNSQNENKEIRKIVLNSLNSEKKLKNKPKKLKLKLKVDKDKMPLKENYNDEKDLFKKLKEEKIYENNAIHYKFQGIPIIGYGGYIPKSHLFYGITESKMIKIITAEGFFCKDAISETQNNILKRNLSRKNIEKITINCGEQLPLSKRESNNRNKKYLISTINNYKTKFDFSFDENYIKENKKRGKKSIYKICQEFKELKKIAIDNKIDKIIKNAFYDSKDNFLNYFSDYYNISDTNRHLYSKKIFNNKKEELPNIFDSLFSIRKVGYTIELIQNDISELLIPYLEESKFELLVNHVFQPKTKNDIPNNWKNLLSLTNIYPIFGLNKLSQDNGKEEDIVGMIKLNKNY